MEEQRKEFMQQFLSNEFSLTDLCCRFEISRTSGYKWIQRFQEEGYDGLKNRSRAPHHIPGETSEDMVRKILEVKNHHYRNEGSIVLLNSWVLQNLRDFYLGYKKLLCYPHLPHLWLVF